MENKEIKTTRPYAHDCNECEECQESILNNQENLCRACWFLFYEKFYKNFSSGNEEVDEIIKNPIYIPPNNEDREFWSGDLNHYQWIPWELLSDVNEIARGGFGIIYKATLIDGLIDPTTTKHHGSIEYQRAEYTKGADVAIKIISTNSSEVFKELNIQRAMSIKLQSLKCIAKIWGITQNPETLEYGIVMEFAEHGDLRKYISKNFDSASWFEKLRTAIDIAEGLVAIHSSGLVHRDLHSGNILQVNDSGVSIGDLGLCQPVNYEATTTEKKEIFGVIPYIPPEVIRGEKFTSAGDIYSFAMLLWELAIGRPPFHDRPHDNTLILNIVSKGIRPEIISPLIPPSIAKIIVKCWDINPENRPTAEEVKLKLEKLDYAFIRFTDESSMIEDLMDEEYIDEEFKYEEAITVNRQFLESENYIKEMLKNDATTNVHSGAFYTSRLLTSQTDEFSDDFFNLPDDLDISLDDDFDY